MADPRFIGEWRSEGSLLVAGFSTRPRKIWTPGTYGSKIHAISICSSDAGANLVALWQMKEMTLQANMGTGAFVDGGGGADTITRSSGSFVSDGWVVGDMIWVSGATTLANDFVVQLTAVAAGTLTFATAIVNTAENFPSGSTIYKAIRRGTYSVPANSGVTSVVAGSMLNSTNLPSVFSGSDAFILVPAGYVLAMSCGTAPATAEILSVIVEGGDYAAP